NRGQSSKRIVFGLLVLWVFASGRRNCLIHIIFGIRIRARSTATIGNSLQAAEGIVCLACPWTGTGTQCSCCCAIRHRRLRCEPSYVVIDFYRIVVASRPLSSLIKNHPAKPVDRDSTICYGGTAIKRHRSFDCRRARIAKTCNVGKLVRTRCWTPKI